MQSHKELLVLQLCWCTVAVEVEFRFQVAAKLAVWSTSVPAVTVPHDGPTTVKLRGPKPTVLVLSINSAGHHCQLITNGGLPVEAADTGKFITVESTQQYGSTNW